jgi:hypothetical protein
MNNEANDIIDNSGISESSMSTFMADDPKACHDTSLTYPIGDPKEMLKVRSEGTESGGREDGRDVSREVEQRSDDSEVINEIGKGGDQ